jgi:hypothetical protein
MAAMTTWRGNSGAKYSSAPFKFGIGLPPMQGIYIISRPVNPFLLGAIYVGECDDFNERLYLKLKNHHQYDCFTRNGATHICLTFEARGRQSRLAIETDLRLGLNPPCNEQ